MATPQFDQNTWYSLQNAATNFYLDCNGISICGAANTNKASFEFFQLARVNDNSPYYIRPHARDRDDDGQPFCVSLSTGQPFMALCNNASATWGAGYWNGRDSSDGVFFFDTQRGDSQRLALNDNGAWSLATYNDSSAPAQNFMQWSSSSLAAINDQSYSTAPAVLSGSGSAAATTTSTLASSTARNAFTSFGATSDSTPAMSSSQQTSSAATSTSSASESPSTMTVVKTETPTVTATSSRASSSSSTAPTAAATLTNGATKSGASIRVLAGLSVMFVALQVNLWIV